jgi:hypothetical protein
LSFTLVLDDFGIKYTNKDNVDHLLAAIRNKYPLKVDWEAKQYVGIHLQWDYTQREVICSMDGYVKQALKKLQHTVPKQHYKGPSKIERPDYGVKVQYVKHDTTAILNSFNEQQENFFYTHEPLTTQCYMHSTTSLLPLLMAPKQR